MRTEVVQFQEAASVCVALKIDQPDFSVEFDQHQKAWITLWKWMEDKKPPKLRNCMVKYCVHDRIRLAYKWELHAWIEDG